MKIIIKNKNTNKNEILEVESISQKSIKVNSGRGKILTTYPEEYEIEGAEINVENI